MKNLEHGHSEEEIEKRFLKKPTPSYLRDWIYGGIDGVVTTFAIVSGVVGGQLSSLVILILGFANLLADGFSMAASNYLGTKSEFDQYQHFKQIEKKHISLIPDGEKREMMQILKNQGLEGDALHQLVNIITSNRELWIKMMLQEEYGLPSSIKSPLLAALCTFFSFLIFGFIPLLPYVLNLKLAFHWSYLCAGLTFFLIGSIKSFWSIKSWLRSGLETFLLGGLTAFIAYFIGWYLHLFFS
ncbi:VIT1/CCC1 transporter family protein [Legionella jamestowniensis]|uniref:Integral membrane protein n=1 Tax=Legionella jamestowniensis TaxID=455 RepID=A0A0W0UI91_9GAMM|nr:VIT1/CCC1 transporter family protein [Legionella jamestowniensis]KTD07587.1 integral membrane protein [Legionella jamestowniensis]SFL58979.1 Predicted Fe2+/Mn2+ transporter, VIT1/CCC1 family [Legionella jamestowniensis DSM 19215]